MSNYIGKTYTFENAAFPNMMLNLYGSASEGKNVVLWERDNSREQQWKVSVENGFKLQTMRNTGFVLSRATDGTNNANVQADITVPCDHQQLAITPLFNGFVKISQNLFSNGTYVGELFLTAVSNDNGSSNGTEDTDEGNVYWASESNSATQRWKMTEVATQSEQGNGNGTLIVGSRPSTLNYNSDCYGRRFDEGQCTWHAFGRAIEVTGKTITFSASYGLHAKTWWNYVTNCTKGSTPRANSIAVWDDGGAYGHVAYVEKVFDDGTVYYTEANWKGTLNVLDAEDGKVRQKSTSAMATRTTSNGTVYRLLGYLYL